MLSFATCHRGLPMIAPILIARLSRLMPTATPDLHFALLRGLLLCLPGVLKLIYLIAT